MTIKQFKRFIDALNAFYKREEEFNKAFETFNSSYTIMEFCPEITSSIFDFIKEEFEDEYDWFTWWYFEKDQGKRIDLKAFDKDENEIILDNYGDIYDFLHENKKENTKNV